MAETLLSADLVPESELLATYPHVAVPGAQTADAPASRLLTAAALRRGGEDGAIEGEALVLRSEPLTDRSGSPYLQLRLRGGDGGTIEARWWRYPYPTGRRPKQGQVCWFAGTVDCYAGETQLRVRQAHPVPDADLAAFMRSATQPLAALRATLEAYVERLPAELAALVRQVLSGETYTRFCEWPAAQQHHGAVRHGLLAHTLRVVAIARQLVAAYQPVGLPHDADLVTAACILHDVGKVHTLPAVAGAALPGDADHFDHITLGILLVRDAAARLNPPLASERLEALMHAILAHHGRKEWGAAVEPQTAEAWLVHLADLAESRLWGWSGEEERE